MIVCIKTPGDRIGGGCFFGGVNMPYIQRDNQGRIVAVSAAQSNLTPEWLDEGNHDLSGFLLDKVLGNKGVDPTVVRALNDSDLALIRVVEDVVDLLIERNLLRFTDLPKSAQEKLLQRRSLRASINSVGLLSDEESGVI